MYYLPVSTGEYLDKYAVLQIKRDEIKDPEKVRYVEEELSLLAKRAEPLIAAYRYHYNCLKVLNKVIWDLSNKLRVADINEFHKNDSRYRVKSKINKLTSSNLVEQKSFDNKSSVHLRPLDNASEYTKYNSYIRYLTLCYDIVYVHSYPAYRDTLSAIFADDPHIVIADTLDPIENATLLDLTVDAYVAHETVAPTPSHLPITDLVDIYDFSYDARDGTTLNPSLVPIHYIVSGRVGDLLHSLYVVKANYVKTGCKGNVYITDAGKWGGDSFAIGVERTHQELYELVTHQSYISKFEVYDGTQQINVNLNSFRWNRKIYTMTWCELLADTFDVPLIEDPWLVPPITWYNPSYKNKILIHRSHYPQRHSGNFLEIVSPIVDAHNTASPENSCGFLTCVPSLYDIFPLKESIQLEYVETFKDMVSAIYSCKLLISNQSSPLAFAYAMFKPAVAEVVHPDKFFYINYRMYLQFGWFGDREKSMEFVGKILEPETKCEKKLSLLFNC